MTPDERRKALGEILNGILEMTTEGTLQWSTPELNPDRFELALEAGSVVITTWQGREGPEYRATFTDPKGVVFVRMTTTSRYSDHAELLADLYAAAASAQRRKLDTFFEELKRGLKEISEDKT